MFNAQECRANAGRCAQLAGCAADPADSVIWVQIARGWLEMAIEIEGGAKPSLIPAERWQTQ